MKFSGIYLDLVYYAQVSRWCCCAGCCLLGTTAC